MANSSILDSVATFERQAKAAGLPEEWITALKAASVDTLGKLSYAVSIPGNALTDELVRTFTTSIRPGSVPTIATNAALKRLVFEAQTFAVAALKAAVQSTDIDAPKKLAAPERQVRLDKLKTTYPGLDITGPLEPAHSLYDLCMTILESEEIRYIAPSKCLSRQQELAGQKPEKEVQLDAAKGSLVVKDVQPKQEIAVSSDLALYQALTRRALAFDLIGLATYTEVNKWHNHMFSLLAQSPAPGFQKVSQGQLLRADRHSFVRMGELANGGLKPNANGDRPLDAIYKRLPNDVSVTYFLLPVQSSDHSSTTKTANGSNHRSSQQKRSLPAPPHFDRNKNMKKGKGKGKSQRRDQMPAQLRGMWSRTKDDEEICFSYNLGKCSKKDCSRKHVCMVPNCQKAHPQHEHQ